VIITEFIDMMSKVEGLDEIHIEMIPPMIAQLAAMQMKLSSRLLAASLTTKSPIARDELLTVDEAAARMKVSTDYLYRHGAKLPFTVRQGRMLRFSANGLEKYLQQRQGH
jgi:excisionase family DNA binding protein